MDNTNTDRLIFEDKEVILVGTAHVSRKSAELVTNVIDQERPDTVCVELCDSRYQSIINRNKWQETNLIKVIKEKKAFLLLSNLLLASFQKRIGKKLGIKPGEEILRAIDAAKEAGAQIELADREIRVTLSRTWRAISFWKKLKLLFSVLTSLGDLDDIDEEEIEKMKQKDMLESLLSEMGETLPEVRQILIDERDRYLAAKIRQAPGSKIVAVVGAGHVPGIKKYWQEPVDLAELEKVPPKGKTAGVIKWLFPAAVAGIILAGFFWAGSSAGTHMIKWWVITNAILSGLGAAAAFAHPLTILAATVAAPITSLNPMVAAGWVAGVSEVFLGKPKVMDFESLPEDIVSFRGFWKNKITRILLVVVFTNVGSSVGTFVAIPIMARYLTL